MWVARLGRCGCIVWGVCPGKTIPKPLMQLSSPQCDPAPGVEFSTLVVMAKQSTVFSLPARTDLSVPVKGTPRALIEVDLP